MDYFQYVISTNLKIGIGVGVGLLLLLLLLFLFLFVFKRKKKDTFEYDEFILALGGKENISNVSYQGSRLSVEVNDKKEIDRDKLQDLGASAIIVTSKKITLIMGVIAKQISAYISNKLS